MQSFRTAQQAAVSPMYCHPLPAFYPRGVNDGRNWGNFGDLGELEQSVFHQEDAVDLSRSSVYNEMKSSNAAIRANLQFGGGLHTNMSSAELASSGNVADTGQLLMQRGTITNVGNVGTMANGSYENWGESGMADNSQQTDTSTDVDTDDKSQINGVQHGAVVEDSREQSGGRTGDQKVLRRLAQNREAARKSRLRKKAYVQQLENSRLKLAQLEQELKQARQQGSYNAGAYSRDHQSHLSSVNGAMAFDLDYARWLDDHQRLINDLRIALNSQVGDNDLRFLVEGVMSHYDEIFRLKDIGTKSDVFHMLSGMWKTPAERCFMWLGGFRSSELLKILGNHLEPLTDQQLLGICNLQQSSQQAEDALSQGMEALQQSLVDTLSCSSASGSGNVADYMGQMAIAMGKLTTLENFIHQADLLRQQTLQQMHRILTTRQAARALLVISDYMSRLRALSSLWLARPKD